MDAMTGTPWELKAPQIVGTSAHVILCDCHSDGRAGIPLTGKMNDWVQPKDLILHLAGKLTVKVRSNALLWLRISRIIYTGRHRAHPGVLWTWSVQPIMYRPCHCCKHGR